MCVCESLRAAQFGLRPGRPERVSVFVCLERVARGVFGGEGSCGWLSSNSVSRVKVFQQLLSFALVGLLSCLLATFVGCACDRSLSAVCHDTSVDQL